MVGVSVGKHDDAIPEIRIVLHDTRDALATAEPTRRKISRSAGIDLARPGDGERFADDVLQHGVAVHDRIRGEGNNGQAIDLLQGPDDSDGR